MPLTSHSELCGAWRPYPWSDVERLVRELGLPFVAATVLASPGACRPGGGEQVSGCLNAVPDPFLFGHMEAAVGTIAAAIAEGERVVVHGDYDADGITATALMVLGLRELGLEPEWYLPSRFNEGYGLSRGGCGDHRRERPGSAHHRRLRRQLPG